MRNGKRARGRIVALMATTILAMSWTVASPVLPALGQTATQQTYNFKISARPVRQALNDISNITGISVVFQDASAGGIIGSPVTGTMTREAALAALLRDTGLSYHFTNGNTVTVTGRSGSSSAQGAPADANGSLLLDTITVTGGRGASPADAPYETAGSGAYISAEQIGRVPPSSPGDMFRNAPGVFSAGNRTGQSLNVNIRGLQGMNRVATLVDGAQQSSSTYRGYKGMSSRTFVDPEFIGGIEVEKGPSGGPFGSGAMGGVVNMRTLNANDILLEGKSYGMKIKGGFGGNSIDPGPYVAPPNEIKQRFDGNDWLDSGNRVGSIALAARNEDFELTGAFAYRRNGNYFAGKNGERLVKRFGFHGAEYWDPMSDLKPGGEVYNTSQDTRSVLLKGKFDFDYDQTVELGYIRYDSTYGEEYGDMNNPFSQYSWDPYQANLSHVTSDMYTAKYTWNPSDNDLIDFHANLWHTRVADEWAAIEILTGSPSISKVDTTGGEIWNTSHFDTQIGILDVKYGATYAYEKINQNPGAQLSIEGDRSVASIFTNADYKPVDWLKLSAGLRYEDYQTNDRKEVDPTDGLQSNIFNPRLGITVEPLDGLQLFATYAKGWRPPSVRETVFEMPGQIEPNPYLRPEKSTNYEVGLNYLKNDALIANDKLRFKAAYFDNDYDDYIVRIYGNRAGLPFAYRTFANIDGAKYKGFELSLSYDAGRFFADANLNRYTDIQYCFAAKVGESASCVEATPPDDYLSVYVPPSYSGSITLGARFLDEKLTTGGRISFAGERAIKRQGTGIESDWRSYQVYDAFASYKVSESLTLNASIDNVFDLYYLDALTEALTPAPGRTFRVSATAKF